MKQIGTTPDGKPIFDSPPAVVGATEAGVKIYDRPPGSIDQAGGFSPIEMVKNIPGSGRRAVEDVLTTVTSPIQTAKALKNLSFGLAQKLWPGEQEHEKYADAVGDALVDRYGSVDAALNSLETDPVGVALDLSSLITGGAGLIRSGAKIAGKSGLEAAAKTAQGMADPFNMAKRGIQKGVAKLKSKEAPADMYAGATKMSTTMDERKRAQAVKTALDLQVMPTPAGLKKLDKMMVKLGDKIDAIMDLAEAQGKQVHFSKVVKPVKELKAEWGASTKLGASAGVKKLDKVMTGYRDQLKENGSMFLAPRQLQELKTDLYRQINFDRSQQKASIPLEEIKKELARGARESIEDFAPDIRDVNRAYGRGEVLREALDRPVSRIQNRDMLGIGVPMKATAGAMLGGDYGAISGLAGGALGLMDNPTNKARMALALHRWNNQPITGPSNFPAVLGAYQIGGLLGQDPYREQNQ